MARPGGIPEEAMEVLKKVTTGMVIDALAMSGLKRADLDKYVTHPFEPAEMLPAPGQGALAIEGRADDLIAQPGGQALMALGVLTPLQKVPGVIQVQLVQQELQDFAVRVVYHDGLNWKETHDELASRLRATLGADVAVKIEQVDAIPPEPNGKVRAAISHCAR